MMRTLYYKNQLQWPYMSKVLNRCFCFFLVRCPVQQIKWKNTNIFIPEAGALYRNMKVQLQSINNIITVLYCSVAPAPTKFKSLSEWILFRLSFGQAIQ